MKEKLLRAGSYVLVAMLSTILTLALTTAGESRSAPALQPAPPA